MVVLVQECMEMKHSRKVLPGDLCTWVPAFLGHAYCYSKRGDLDACLGGYHIDVQEPCFVIYACHGGKIMIMDVNMQVGWSFKEYWTELI